MSKPIKLTETIIEDIKNKFLEKLNGSLKDAKLFDGKISFSETYSWKEDDKASVVFTTKAFMKMFKLIQEFSDEVAWHGVAHRDSEKENVFYITDILVYPQEVTGSTVNTDQSEYQTWLMNLEDDTFNNLRMQGHSHVNMLTTPSSVDTTHQESILQCLDDSMFYIFMIWNKSLSRNIKVFDLKNNTLYENDDVEVIYADLTEDECQGFIKESKDLVKRKSYSSYSSGYNGYNNFNRTPITPAKEEEKNIADQKKTANEIKSETKSEIKSETKSDVGSGWRGRGLDSLEDYYADFPYVE